MAKSTLPVDFTDDVLNEAMSGKRRYKLIYNDDGTVSLEDVTAYDQIGSDFGSKQVNETNTAVNAAADAGKIIDSLATVRAVTQAGYMAGALALKELDDSLGDVQIKKSIMVNVILGTLSSLEEGEQTVDLTSYGFTKSPIPYIRGLRYATGYISNISTTEMKIKYFNPSSKNVNAYMYVTLLEL